MSGCSVNNNFAMIVVVCCMFLSHGALAQIGVLRTLNDAGLYEAFSGKTHVSRYRQNIEEYGGVVFEETYNVDGTLRYSAGDVSATGRWRIENDAICFRYDDNRLIPACFVIAYEAGCFYSYEILNDGTVRGLHDGEWWIRSTLQGTDPDCDRDAIS